MPKQLFASELVQFCNTPFHVILSECNPRLSAFIFNRCSFMAASEALAVATDKSVQQVSAAVERADASATRSHGGPAGCTSEYFLISVGCRLFKTSKTNSVVIIPTSPSASAPTSSSCASEWCSPAGKCPLPQRFTSVFAYTAYCQR